MYIYVYFNDKCMIHIHVCTLVYTVALHWRIHAIKTLIVGIVTLMSSAGVLISFFLSWVVKAHSITVLSGW